jgi:hypothetical protein
MHTDVIEDGKGGEGRGRKRKRREGDVKEDEEGGEELEESEEDEGDEGEEEEEEEEKEELEESEEEEEEEEEDDEDPFELEPRGKGLMEELFAPFEYVVSRLFSFLALFLCEFNYFLLSPFRPESTCLNNFLLAGVGTRLPPRPSTPCPSWSGPNCLSSCASTVALATNSKRGASNDHVSLPYAP